uniref:EXS domain-containing protein n=1 Tax=Chaetoceros debilis TaxID=122233 RepID=A0A7S3VHH0_9STRA|mmetsp:Transcript_18738/g.28464  ORF Transcript_18738/g.28464 Transcript_18738/m.28464 type:complete len:597 (+) Transcript_18738:176-1966(+)
MLLSKSFESCQPTRPLLRKFVTLHLPIFFCLYILTDTETNYSNDEDRSDGQHHSSTRHLAVFTALSRHPPSMRVFRGMFSIALLGFCASLSLYKMEHIFGRNIIQKLFFSTPYTLMDDNNGQDLIVEEGYELTKMDDEEDGHNDEDAEGESDEDVGGTKYKRDQQGDPIDTLYPDNESSADIICNMSLDLLLFISVALFLFTLSSSSGGQYIDQTKSDPNAIYKKLGDIAAPIFPLILFFFCAIKTMLPWTRRRQQFWTVVSYTLGAPLYDVSFRDGFIGDIFTSMVRPMQDIAYTSFYLLGGLQGWWLYRNQTTEDQMNQPVESSWLLHTIVLPACTVSPLWWRFCQCLRQSFDSKQRWPYLGNAAKYFFAAQVAMFGTFDPQKKGSSIWIVACVCATFYQLFWDVFMDWGLLTWVPRPGILGGTFHIRQERLYERKSVYVLIFITNTFLRFFWALTIMPSKYLSPSGELLQTFSADFSTFIAPTLACAEIIRRFLWGLLRVELEVIKVSEKEDGAGYQVDAVGTEKELEPMCIGGGAADHSAISLGSNLVASAGLTFDSDTAVVDEAKLLWELSIYSIIFTGMGILAAVHRQVM